MNELQLTDSEFSRVQSLVYNTCGIHLNEGKKELVRTRMAKRLRELGVGTLSEYLRVLSEDRSGEEMVEFINRISTNFTHFFREPKHFDFLEKKVLPAFGRGGGNRYPKGFRAWSAGCSSGEEPYSLAICLQENLGEYASQAHILATDISTKVLSAAAEGVYKENAVSNIERPLLKKYFFKGRKRFEGHVRVKPVIADMVEFARLNLLDNFTFSQPFDVIFCRNVMIYFDRKVQNELVNKFFLCLNPGGHLLIGHSESLMSLQHPFSYVQPAIYQKKGA